ncbi:hypothetical protein T484DRAFT_1766711, partial [Baffinella frigidus]
MRSRMAGDTAPLVCIVFGMVVALAMVTAADDPALPRLISALKAETSGIKCPSAAIRRAGGSKDSPGVTTLIHAGLFLLRSGLRSKAKACLLQAHSQAPTSPWVWAAIAEAARGKEGDAGASSAADAALKEGLRLGGRFSKTPQLGLPMHWDVLGPFPIGKGEVDGDPLESPGIGGVEKARGSDKGERRQFPSEYAEGGFVQWQALSAGQGGNGGAVQIEFPGALSAGQGGNGGAVQIEFSGVQWNKLLQATNSMPILEIQEIEFSGVQWNKLLQATNSMPILEIQWNKLLQSTNSMPKLEIQAWAVADFAVLQPGTFRIACQGVHTFSVDRVGMPWLSGDIYRSGMLWPVLSLAPGVHTIYAK